MSNPLEWMVGPPGTFRPVFLSCEYEGQHSGVDGMGDQPFYFSTHFADNAMCSRGMRDYIFAYTPNDHKLSLIAVSKGSAKILARVPCPDTWEEALTWLRMSCQLVHT